MKQENGHVVETAVEARAGYLDRPVMVVLVVSTFLAASIFAVLYFAYFV